MDYVFIIISQLKWAIRASRYLNSGSNFKPPNLRMDAFFTLSD